jgi:hypothetical protein
VQHCDAPVIEGKPVRPHERAREERLVATLSSRSEDFSRTRRRLRRPTTAREFEF